MRKFVSLKGRVLHILWPLVGEGGQGAGVRGAKVGSG